MTWGRGKKAAGRPRLLRARARARTGANGAVGCSGGLGESGGALASLVLPIKYDSEVEVEEEKDDEELLLPSPPAALVVASSTETGLEVRKKQSSLTLSPLLTLLLTASMPLGRPIEKESVSSRNLDIHSRCSMSSSSHYQFNKHHIFYSNICNCRQENKKRKFFCRADEKLTGLCLPSSVLIFSSTDF